MSTQPRRLASGGRIDRTHTLAFSFDGRRLSGHPGDTIASALLANDVSPVARSFKYHRPRGIWGAWVEDPGAVVDLTLDHRHDPNARAATTALADGMRLRGVHGWPRVGFDLLAGLDLLHGFMPAGFYYKTFMKPTWHLWEGTIRRLAGLGRVRDFSTDERCTTAHAHCDVLVVGAGPAGLAAARAAAGAELRVLLVDDQGEPGGSLLWREMTIDGLPGDVWAARTWDALAHAPGVRVMARTTAFAYFDHDHLALIEQLPAAPIGWAPYRLWKVRARRVVLATGALERPLVFPDNDVPGVMSAAAVSQYLRRYAVLAGRRALVFTNNDDAYDTALALAAAGAGVRVVDVRHAPGDLALARAAAAGIPVRRGAAVVGVLGPRRVRGVRVADHDPARTYERTFECDLLAVSGGWNPTVHLHCQAGGTPVYDEVLAAFVPGQPAQGERCAGGAHGVFEPHAVLADGHAAGAQAARDCGATAAPPAAPVLADRPWSYGIEPWWETPRPRTRQWVDLQSDVTAADVRLAARENYASVEHLKRYTTLGMATDQGRTSNVNGLAILAGATGRAIAQVGTTRFRPPFVPVPLGALAGQRRGALYSPVRCLPAHTEHQRLGARFDEYGGWQRPACYPRAGEGEQQAIHREVLAVRNTVGLFDGSPLGKIEVTGPDAGTFLDLIYYNTLSNLRPGRVRYCLVLTENGKVFDDGVVARLAEDRFVLSPSTSHAPAMAAMVEEWRQCEYPHMRVTVSHVTAAWATLSVSGPRAREVLERLATDIDLAREALPHMAVAEGRVCGVPARIARVSFTGETGFELSVPAGYGASLWRELMRLGEPCGITAFGIESLMVLRAEKGYILIGRDADGTTEPQDLGMSGPLARKTVDFIGKRSLLRPDSRREDRRQLVGLLAEPAGVVLPNGAHVVESVAGVRRSIGYVTSAYASPTLGHGIAMALVERGRERMAGGASVEVFHLGRDYRARVVEPAFHDPRGERLHG